MREDALFVKTFIKIYRDRIEEAKSSIELLKLRIIKEKNNRKIQKLNLKLQEAQETELELSENLEAFRDYIIDNKYDEQNSTRHK